MPCTINPATIQHMRLQANGSETSGAKLVRSRLRAILSPIGVLVGDYIFIGNGTQPLPALAL